MLNRGIFFAHDIGIAADYVSLVFHKVWGEGGHMTDDVLIHGIVDAFDWSDSEFQQFVRSAAATERYEASTRKAHGRGVFGVPTIIVGEEMWWGNDRFEFLEERLAELDAHLAAAG